MNCKVISTRCPSLQLRMGPVTWSKQLGHSSSPNICSLSSKSPSKKSSIEFSISIVLFALCLRAQYGKRREKFDCLCLTARICINLSSTTDCVDSRWRQVHMRARPMGWKQSNLILPFPYCSLRQSANRTMNLSPSAYEFVQFESSKTFADYCQWNWADLERFVATLPARPPNPCLFMHQSCICILCDWPSGAQKHVVGDWSVCQGCWERCKKNTARPTGVRFQTRSRHFALYKIIERSNQFRQVY